MNPEYIKNIIAILENFYNSHQRCIQLSIVSVSSGSDKKREMRVRFKKYTAEDLTLHLIIELMYFENDEIRVAEPVLIEFNDIASVANDVARSITLFENGISDDDKLDVSMMEVTDVDIDKLVDVKDLEREEIKKFIIKNGYRLHRVPDPKRTVVPINEIPQFLERRFVEEGNDIKCINIAMQVKDIGVYAVCVTLSGLLDYNDVTRMAVITSSNIEKEPYVFYCIDPCYNPDLYDDKAKKKIIDGLSDHLDHLIKVIKNKNSVDKIKVQCTCTVFYKKDNVEGYYEY